MVDTRKTTRENRKKLIEPIDRSRLFIPEGAVTPGYTPRWVNLWDGNYEYKLAVGYRVVNARDSVPDDNSKSDDPFASAYIRAANKGDNRQKCILMEIQQDHYNELREARYARNRDEQAQAELLANQHVGGSFSRKYIKGN